MHSWTVTYGTAPAKFFFKTVCASGHLILAIMESLGEHPGVQQFETKDLLMNQQAENNENDGI